MWWAGLVWAITCGWAVSSYTSSFIFRLPRKEYPFGRKPYCDECNALLQPKDLFPVFSFLLTDGKCRYCGSKVPLSYYLVELLYPLIFIQLYISYQFGDVFFVMAVAVSALVILVMAAYEAGYYSPMTMLALAAMGILMQTLATASVTSGFISGFSCFFVAVLWHRFAAGEKEEVDLRALPPAVWMAATIGCWLSIPCAALSIVLWLALQKVLHWVWQPKYPLVIQMVSFAVSLAVVAFQRY